MFGFISEFKGVFRFFKRKASLLGVHRVVSLKGTAPWF